MIRIDLFNPVRPSVYGTATTKDIMHVSLAALGLAAVIGVISLGIARLGAILLG